MFCLCWRRPPLAEVLRPAADRRAKEGRLGSPPQERNRTMAERKHEQSQNRSESESLKEREYRDKEGDVHHHTRTYMEQHKGERGKGGASSDRDEAGGSTRDEEE